MFLHQGITSPLQQQRQNHRQFDANTQNRTTDLLTTKNHAHTLNKLSQNYVS